MDYLSETTKKIPPGDRRTFLGEQGAESPNADTFKPSDIPGFVNPIVNGKVDKTSYIAEESIQAGEGIPMSRTEALEQSKKRSKDSAIEMYPKMAPGAPL